MDTWFPRWELYCQEKCVGFCLICITSIIENKAGFAESNDGSEDGDDAIYDDNNAYYFEINMTETEL